MASNTTKLDLLKKDPVTDGNDTFNIKLMLNDNWDKIDAFAETTEQEMSELFTSVSDGKQLVSSAITDKGVPTNKEDTFQIMANNITSIQTKSILSGNAVASQVLSGKTFYSDSETKQTGTMPNRGNASGTITSQGGSIKIRPGYYTGGNIGANITNLTGANIKSSVAVGGVTGNFTDDGTATSGDMLSGKVAYSKGQKVTGSITPRGNASRTITTQGGSVSISPGYYTGGSINASFSNLLAGNIRSGVTVGGVRGSLIIPHHSGTTFDPNGRFSVSGLEFKPKIIYGYRNESDSSDKKHIETFYIEEFDSNAFFYHRVADEITVIQRVPFGTNVGVTD